MECVYYGVSVCEGSMSSGPEACCTVCVLQPFCSTVYGDILPSSMVPSLILPSSILLSSSGGPSNLHAPLLELRSFPASSSSA